MKLSARSYPHPVVGNGDDAPAAAFQATYEYASDSQFYYLSVSVACSSSTLTSLVANGQACFALHVECSNTMFRHIYPFTSDRARFEIRASHLNDAVEVNAFVLATTELTAYRLGEAHSDYGDTLFSIRPADILAIGEGQLFYAEQTHDSMRRVGSIMVIERSSKDGDHAMELDLNSNKLRVLLSKTDFESYGQLKHITDLTGALTTTIVLPVLVHALTVLKDSGDDFRDLKWHRTLTRRMELLSLSTDGEPLTNAQQLLSLPIRRALTSAIRFAGSQQA